MRTHAAVVALFSSALALVACAPAPVPTIVPPTSVPSAGAITATAVLPRLEDIKADRTKPLGSPENPLVMALAPSSTSQELLVNGDAIAKEMKDITGLTIKTVVPTSYSALIEAMGSGNAHIGWLAPLQYVLAKQKGYADVVMATLRINAKDKQLHDHYGMQYLAAKSSNFKPYFDEAKGISTAPDAKTALAQFDGKSVCLTDPLSASGYVFPAGVLAKAGVKTSKVIETKAHPTTARALYTGGQCDFGATFIDVREDDAKLKADLPDLKDKVVVIWRSDEFIPNDNVSLSSKLDKDTRAKLVEGFKKLGDSPTGKTALKAVYGIDGLKTVDDTFYDELRSILEAGGVDVSKLVK